MSSSRRMQAAGSATGSLTASKRPLGALTWQVRGVPQQIVLKCKVWTTLPFACELTSSALVVWSNTSLCQHLSPQDVSEWARDLGATVKDFIAFQRRGSKLLVKLIPQAEARSLLAAAPSPMAATTSREQAAAPGPDAAGEQEQGAAVAAAARGRSRARGACTAGKGAQLKSRLAGRKRRISSDEAEAPARTAHAAEPQVGAAGAATPAVATLAAATPASPYVGAYELADDAEEEQAVPPAARRISAAGGQAAEAQAGRRAGHGRALRPGSRAAPPAQAPASAATNLALAGAAAASGDPGTSMDPDALVGCRIKGERDWHARVPHQLCVNCAETVQQSEAGASSRLLCRWWRACPGSSACVPTALHHLHVPPGALFCARLPQSSGMAMLHGMQA